MVNLIDLYHKEPFMRFKIQAIIMRPIRLRSKRDAIRNAVKEFYTPSVDVSMRDVRELHYLTHPNDKKRL